MRRRCFGSALAALAGAGVLSGCAYRSVPFIDYRPLLFTVRGPASRSRAWLFGGIHIGLARFYPLPDPVERAWQQSSRLACEIDSYQRWERLRDAFRERALLPEGQRIDQFVDTPTLTALKHHLGMGNLEWEGRRRLRPWAMAMLLSSADDNRMGAQAGMGIDAHFLARARAQGRPVIELETMEEQIEAIAGGSDTDQAAQLADRFARLQRWDSPLSDIVDAWRRGDEARLVQLKSNAFGDGQRLPGLRRRLFGERDERMARRMVAAMTEPGDLFALVGALHLVGNDSLPQALRALGMQVDSVAYAD